jgi:hypothetical protein
VTKIAVRGTIAGIGAPWNISTSAGRTYLFGSRYAGVSAFLGTKLYISERRLRACEFLAAIEADKRMAFFTQLISGSIRRVFASAAFAYFRRVSIWIYSRLDKIGMLAPKHSLCFPVATRTKCNEIVDGIGAYVIFVQPKGSYMVNREIGPNIPAHLACIPVSFARFSALTLPVLPFVFDIPALPGWVILPNPLFRSAPIRKTLTSAEIMLGYGGRDFLERLAACVANNCDFHARIIR